MDSSFTIKPPPGVQRRALRDPVSVRSAVETDLVGDKAVTATYGDNKNPDDRDGHSRQRNNHGEARPDHALQDLVADPNSRDVIYRERDVRSSEREHPDHALMRLRAYRPALPDAAAPPNDDPHADIRA